MCLYRISVRACASTAVRVDFLQAEAEAKKEIQDPEAKTEPPRSSHPASAAVSLKPAQQQRN